MGNLLLAYVSTLLRCCSYSYVKWDYSAYLSIFAQLHSRHDIALYLHTIVKVFVGRPGHALCGGRVEEHWEACIASKGYPIWILGCMYLCSCQLIRQWPEPSAIPGVNACLWLGPYYPCMMRPRSSGAYLRTFLHPSGLPLLKHQIRYPLAFSVWHLCP